MWSKVKPGRELDAMIADAMGIPIYEHDQHRDNHSWLDDLANYPYITDGAGLILWLEPGHNGQPWQPSTEIQTAMMAWEWLEINNPWRPMKADPGDISLSRYWLNAKPAVIVVMVDGAEIVDYRPGLPPSTRYNFAIWADTYPHAIALAVLATEEAGPNG